MKVFGVVTALSLLASAAFAQSAPQAVTIDPQLWGEMAQAVGQVSMPLSAHQQIQQIIANVQREALARESKAKAEQEKALPKK